MYYIGSLGPRTCSALAIKTDSRIILTIKILLVNYLKLRDTKRRQQLLELQEDVVLAPAEYIRQDFPRVMMLGRRKARYPAARFLTPPV